MDIADADSTAITGYGDGSGSSNSSGNEDCMQDPSVCDVVGAFMSHDISENECINSAEGTYSDGQCEVCVGWIYYNSYLGNQQGTIATTLPIMGTTPSSNVPIYDYYCDIQDTPSLRFFDTSEGITYNLTSETSLGEFFNNNIFVYCPDGNNASCEEIHFLAVDDCIEEYDECGICNGDGIEYGACNCNNDYVDGICETCENGVIVDNDIDDDEICDNVDTCLGFDDNVDADADGIPDDCDICPNDAEDDADDDGICGDEDIYPYCYENYYDCYDYCGGEAIIDECEECTEGYTGLQYNYLMDECGACEGQGIPEGTCDCEENLDTCNVCPYLNPDEYGNCDNTLGWIPVGLDQCQLVTGCGFGLDEEWFFDTQQECLDGCENCRIINPSDYGDCALPLGWGFDGNDCQHIEGCGYGDDEGWFYSSYDDCMIRCVYNWDNLDNEIKEIPTTFTINAYPNPFNPTTNIHFEIPEYANVVIQIFNLNGQIVFELFNGYKTPGAYTLKWSGENYTSGTYLLRMTSASFTHTQKISLVK